MIKFLTLFMIWPIIGYVTLFCIVVSHALRRKADEIDDYCKYVLEFLHNSPGFLTGGSSKERSINVIIGLMTWPSLIDTAIELMDEIDKEYDHHQTT